MSVRPYEPPCGERYEFHMTAYRDDRESPPSNRAYWSVGECPEDVAVIFRTVHLLDGDLWVTGPIYGRFWANDQVLEFRAARWLWTFGALGVQELFDWIHRGQLECPGCEYEAPLSNHVVVPLRSYDDLTIGFQIVDYGRGSDGAICDCSDSIPADRIPYEFTYSIRCPLVGEPRCELTVTVIRSLFPVPEPPSDMLEF